MLASCAAAQQDGEQDQFIAVKFTVDGTAVPCDLKVDLYSDSHHIVPERIAHGFVVPSHFRKQSSAPPPQKELDVGVICGEYSLHFEVNPSWVSAGQWEVGIAYPTYAIERFRRSAGLERGAWLSYLISECNGCDAGVVTMVAQPYPPAFVLSALQKEQPNASGERARDIAYALAVFNYQYQRNRDYLVSSLNRCLSRFRESPEDDVCNGELLDFITNLYWRGDDGLLALLLQIVDTRRDIILEIGTFYADLLDRRSAAVLQGLSILPNDKQELICRMAAQDELVMDSPEFERVRNRLRETHNDVADRCLAVLSMDCRGCER